MEDLQGERVREKNGFQSAGNPVYIYIIISTLTPSSSLSLSFGCLLKKKKKKMQRDKRGRALGCRLLKFVVVVCIFFSACSYFLKTAASVGKVATFFLNLLPAPLFNTSVSSPCNFLVERVLVRRFWPLSLGQGGKNEGGGGKKQKHYKKQRSLSINKVWHARLCES